MYKPLLGSLILRKDVITACQSTNCGLRVCSNWQQRHGQSHLCFPASCHTVTVCASCVSSNTETPCHFTATSEPFHSRHLHSQASHRVAVVLFLTHSLQRSCVDGVGVFSSRTSSCTLCYIAKHLRTCCMCMPRHNITPSPLCPPTHSHIHRALLRTSTQLCTPSVCCQEQASSSRGMHSDNIQAAAGTTHPAMNIMHTQALPPCHCSLPVLPRSRAPLQCVSRDGPPVGQHGHAVCPHRPAQQARTQGRRQCSTTGGCVGGFCLPGRG